MRKNINAHTKLALLPKKTRGESVVAQMIMRYGNEDALAPYREELILLPALMWRGTQKFDYQGIRDRLDALMSTMDLGGHAGLITSSIKSERQYILPAMELLAHVISRPTLKAEEFQIVKQREIDDCEEVKNDPQRLCFQELERLKNPWPKSSIHYVQSYEEKISELKKLSVDRIKEAYEALVACQQLSLGFVGDVDTDGIQMRLPTLFSELHSKTSFERIKRPFIKNIMEDRKFDTPDKEMAVIAMAANFPMRDDHKDFAALKMANYIFGETMNSRLMNRIREKEGISYGAGSWIEISRHEENACINMYALAAPLSVGRAERAMKEEWFRFISDGVLEAELKSAQESIWLSFENLLSSDSYVSGTLARDLEISRDFMWREKLFQRMRDLSSKEIKDAAQNWWQDIRFSLVVAGDQAKIRGQ